MQAIGDDAGMLHVFAEVAIVGYIIHFRGECPAFFCCIKHFGHSRNRKREEFGFTRIERIQDFPAGFVQRNTGSIVVYLHPEIVFQPGQGIPEFFVADPHIVTGFQGCIHRGLQACRYFAHFGQHLTSFTHQKADIDPNGTMNRTTAAQGASSEQQVSHFSDCLFVQFPCTR